MILKQKWNILGAVLLIVVVVLLYTKQPICPDDFQDVDAEMAAFQTWGENFYNNNPDASISEFSQARHQFYIDNNCTAALQRYDDYAAGKVSPEDMAIINAVIDESISTSTSAGER